MTDSQPNVQPSVDVAPQARGAILAAVLLALFLSSLDQTVVGTALPRIVTDLHGNELYTWVVTAYLLSSTITVPIYGKFSDVFGRKPMLLIGVVVFLVGSALSGLSQSMVQLVAFRALQGLGAGALFPVSLAIIGDLFSPRERGRYQGLFGAVFGLSFILGPFIGGFLTDNASWRWVFYVNLPVGVVALAVITVVLPNVRRGASVRDLDYLGIVLFTAGVIPLLIGLTNKGQTDSSGHLYGWVSPQVGLLLLIAAVFLTLFLLVERRAREPIIPLDLFRDRSYAATNIATFLVAVALFAAVIYLPRYYQAVRAVSATQSGYEIWPLLVGLIGGSIASGLLISRTGKYKVILLSAMVSLIVGNLLMTRLTAQTDSVVLWSWMLWIGLGVGPAMAGYTVVVQSIVPRDRLGVATSTLTFLRQIGGSVGLALAGTVFTSTFTGDLPGKLVAARVPARIATRIANQFGGNLTGVGGIGKQVGASLPPQFQALVPHIVTGIHDAVASAVASLFWLGAGAGILALVAALFIREVPLRGTVPAPEATEREGEVVRPARTEPEPAQ
jgi:EmrB/QacA subfamily drug resistance transporter